MQTLPGFSPLTTSGSSFASHRFKNFPTLCSYKTAFVSRDQYVIQEWRRKNTLLFRSNFSSDSSAHGADRKEIGRTVPSTEEANTKSNGASDTEDVHKGNSANTFEKFQNDGFPHNLHEAGKTVLFADGCQTSGFLKKDTSRSEELGALSSIPRIRRGLLITIILFVVLTCIVLLVDFNIWQLIQRPHSLFFLSGPFLASTIISGYLGWYCVPLLKRIKVHQIIRKEGPSAHHSKAGTPTMGGLFFIPIGVGVSRLVTRFASYELQGVACATILFAIIGLLDDGLSIMRNHNYGLPGWLKLLMQVAVGAFFFLWLDSIHLPSPYRMKALVLLPPPFGLWYIGKWYLPLNTFCFAAMANGVNLTDGLDGLAAGTAALGFIAMSIAVLPIYPALSIFGASMAGASMGFLLHNRHKASIFMGDTGSLALGGALAAMASCTGLFLPLFLVSGVYVIETISVLGQVSYFKFTKHLTGVGRRWLRMAPFHHHLELVGFEEHQIVVGAYVLTFVLACLAAYVGLSSY